MKCTQGPYTLSCALSSDPYHIRYLDGANGESVAQIRSGFKHIGDNDFGQEEALANAHLLGASWDMYKALVDARQALQNAIHSATPSSSASMIAWQYAEDQSRRALCKAEGVKP